MPEDCFGIFVEFHNRSIVQYVLKRMVYNRARLMMLDLDRRLLPGPVARPLDMPSNDVLGSLKPLEADYGSRAALRLSPFDTTRCKLVHLLSGDGMFGEFHPGLHRNANPRIRNALVEFVRMAA